MNNGRDFWQQVLNVVRSGAHGVLMCVVESLGSSPGRAGFKMFVTRDGTMHGSIGGGSMEHKLVELTRSLMDRPEVFPFIKRQVHRDSEARDRSGMICSGEQTVAFFRLGIEHMSVLQAIVNTADPDAVLNYGDAGISIASGSAGDSTEKEEAWFRERINAQPRIAIIGGGHVGLALSRTMHQLGFHVSQFDHREALNTMEANTWAHHRQVIDFEHIGEVLPEDPALYVALVSFGYRTDDIVLRKLLGRRYKYIGLLGSAEKVRLMFEALRRDGFAEEEIARVHAPIGLPIHSRTPEEIAISIAAEIIRVKNADTLSAER